MLRAEGRRFGEPTLNHRPLDGATGLVGVGAIREGAARNKRPELGEESLDFLRPDVPKLDTSVHTERTRWPLSTLPSTK